ncbi:carboxypeptidase-like regulatory domain-containing protein [Kriegella aquimaris]|uniref:CarboxypepD_reg-like domain-containing protein n=1 Tax=Kriegella aquimaris TaxID=192904 RepID=A0A1G9X493_9FLAO|nr:carboxypeptidase-like regulatory domain-containing protein [Kriegella aquimaris]SDM91175.1 CarboxypepD_reg-like domain-containing protein [Kriegella aquimaris]
MHDIKSIRKRSIAFQLGTKVLFVVFVVFAPKVEAQTLFTNQLEGRVYSKDGDVAATHVLNTTSKKAAITDINGFFSITAHLSDTLVFSAVQYKRRSIVVTSEILNSKFLQVPLEEAMTELDEVIVMPYNLTGDMAADLKRMEPGPIVSGSTLDLPNAGVRVISQSERKLHEATTGGGIIPLFPIINGISGRTKMLKTRVKRDQKYERTQRVREFYSDSLFTAELKIPEAKISDFMYFCEVDTVFQRIVDSRDQIKILEYMGKKSAIYRENNELE